MMKVVDETYPNKVLNLDLGLNSYMLVSRKIMNMLNNEFKKN